MEYKFSNEKTTYIQLLFIFILTELTIDTNPVLKSIGGFTISVRMKPAVKPRYESTSSSW